MPSATAVHDPRVDAVRRFNRFYTRRIGVLRPASTRAAFRSPKSACSTSSRTRAHRSRRRRSRAGSGSMPATCAASCAASPPTATCARRARTTTPASRTSRSPPPAGRRSRRSIARPPTRSARCSRRCRTRRRRAASARCARSRTCWATGALRRAVVLREHRPGDIGWVIARHGALYAQEYGWDITFEAMVADIAAEFVTRLRPARERCWIAERDGAQPGLRVRRAPQRDGGAAPPAAGRAVRARPRHRTHGWSTSASTSRAAPAIAR